jgi:beta-glucosidase-like glycosyl hydrolase
MIREHRLGAVWVSHNMKERDEIIARVKEAADYPILIMCDAEDGHPEHPIPGMLSLSAANEREEYAYSFGRVTASSFAALGYNVICNPILDRRIRRASPGAQTRSISPDREVVARLGAAVIRGMHDGGTLSVAKHYPSPMKTTPHDTHLREGYATDTKEELIEDALYPYRKLMEEGEIRENPIITPVAAISAGIVEDEALLDLCYEEDSSAQVDLNCVMTGDGQLVEIQGTGEGRAFTIAEQQELVKLCAKGIKELNEIQKEVLGGKVR